MIEENGIVKNVVFATEQKGQKEIVRKSFKDNTLSDEELLAKYKGAYEPEDYKLLVIGVRIPTVSPAGIILTSKNNAERAQEYIRSVASLGYLVIEQGTGVPKELVGKRVIITGDPIARLNLEGMPILGDFYYMQVFNWADYIATIKDFSKIIYDKDADTRL